MPRKEPEVAKQATDNSGFVTESITALTDHVVEKEEVHARECARAISDLRRRAERGDAAAETCWAEMRKTVPELCEAVASHATALEAVTEKLITVHTESMHADGLFSDGLTHIRKLCGAQEKYELIEWVNTSPTEGELRHKKIGWHCASCGCSYIGPWTGRAAGMNAAHASVTAHLVNKRSGQPCHAQKVWQTKEQRAIRRAEQGMPTVRLAEETSEDIEAYLIKTADATPLSDDCHLTMSESPCEIVPDMERCMGSHFLSAITAVAAAEQCLGGGWDDPELTAKLTEEDVRRIAALGKYMCSSAGLREWRASSSPTDESMTWENIYEVVQHTMEDQQYRVPAAKNHLAHTVSGAFSVGAQEDLEMHLSDAKTKEEAEPRELSPLDAYKDFMGKAFLPSVSATLSASALVGATGERSFEKAPLVPMAAKRIAALAYEVEGHTGLQKFKARIDDLSDDATTVSGRTRRNIGVCEAMMRSKGHPFLAGQDLRTNAGGCLDTSCILEYEQKRKAEEDV